LSGTSIEGRKYQPSKIILDYMIKWGIENKYSVLHLGGGVGGNADALYKFKKGFSSTDMKFSTIRMVVNEDIYQELSLRSGFSIDEISNLSDFFPIYRKS
jgi:lipid II:glycine glycyltransferase (peptidoglycan interpeptide bridge formation enzyme)